MNIDDIKKAPNDAAAALLAGMAMAIPPTVQKTADGVPFILLPNHLAFKDLSDLLPKPTRLKQTVTLQTPDSFAQYLNLFGTSDATIVFADDENSKLEAVLDYHQTGVAPAWGSHRAVCQLVHTKSWEEWTANNYPKNQNDFSAFLEEHIPDIAEPAGADLVEIARTFEASKITKFQSHQRAEDGSIKFLFDEDVQGSARSGSVKIPAKFNLVLQPYFGGKKYAVVARLRYRLYGGSLSLSYELERLDDVVEVAFNDVLLELQTKTQDRVRAVVRGLSK